MVQSSLWGVQSSGWFPQSLPLLSTQALRIGPPSGLRYWRACRFSLLDRPHWGGVRSSLGASWRKCSSKFHLESITNPRYLMLIFTDIGTPITTTSVFDILPHFPPWKKMASDFWGATQRSNVRIFCTTLFGDDASLLPGSPFLVRAL